MFIQIMPLEKAVFGREPEQREDGLGRAIFQAEDSDPQRYEGIVSTFVLLAVALAVAIPAPVAAEGNQKMQVTEQVRSVVGSNNEFAFDVYGELRSTETGNLFFSPASISTALAMTYAGAEGETEQARTGWRR